MVNTFSALGSAAVLVVYAEVVVVRVVVLPLLVLHVVVLLHLALLVLAVHRAGHLAVLRTCQRVTLSVDGSNVQVTQVVEYLGCGGHCAVPAIELVIPQQRNCRLVCAAALA